jgi:hypothetical protein
VFTVLSGLSGRYTEGLVPGSGPSTAPGLKGGALEMSTTNLSSFVLDEAPDRLTVPVIHGGFEYSDYPLLAVARIRGILVKRVGEESGRRL